MIFKNAFRINAINFATQSSRITCNDAILGIKYLVFKNFYIKLINLFNSKK